MKYLTVLIIIFLSGCANLNPEAISSYDLNLEESLVFDESPDQVAKAVLSIIADNRWKVLYNGDTLPSKNHSSYSNANVLGSGDFDAMAWDKTLNSRNAPFGFIQAKTPTTLTSYGASLFVIVFNNDMGGSSVAITGSTSQIVEKKKLADYISMLVTGLKQKLG